MIHILTHCLLIWFVSNERRALALPHPSGDYFHFSEKGVTGRSGPTGATGLPGDLGRTGSTGHTGIPGFVGKTGSTGLPGRPGQKGGRGITGWTGAPGPLGPPGMNGAPGLSGMKGITGATGKPGNDGRTGRFSNRAIVSHMTLLRSIFLHLHLISKVNNYLYCQEQLDRKDFLDCQVHLVESLL